MQCDKHPTYKGLRKKKKSCPTCDKIYQQVQQEKTKNSKNNYQQFISLTTPELKVSSFHVLAEVSCIMLYGKLPPYFWRKDTECAKKIKEHFSSKYSMLIKERKRLPGPMKELDSLLWRIWAQDLTKKAAETIRRTEIVENVEHKENVDRVKINIPAREIKPDIWDILGD